MDYLQQTLINSLHKIRKSGVGLTYPIENQRLEEIISTLLNNYHFHCKTKPRVKSKNLSNKGIIDYTSIIVDMALVHIGDDGLQSSPTIITLYFQSYLTEDDTPEFAISASFNNKYKEALYRPKIVAQEEDVLSYVNTVLTDLSNTPKDS
jgi:hypothetical protein